MRQSEIKGTEGTRGVRELRCPSENILDNPSHPFGNRDNLKNYEMFRNRDIRRPRRSKRLKNPERTGYGGQPESQPSTVEN